MKKIASIFATLSIVLSLAGCSGGSGNGNSADSSTVTTAADSFSIANNWKIGIQMWTFNHFTFMQALDKVDSAGVKNIEAFWGMPIGGSSKDSFGINMSADTKAMLKQALQAKGIQIVAMGVISPDTREEWQKAFDLAKEFGLSYITAEPKKNQWDMVDSMAGAYGIKIAIHDHPKPNMYWSPDSVLAAVQGHPNIGSCADVGHWARNGLNPVDCLKKLEGHIYGVHLKDIKVFGQTDAEDTIVSKGVIDFPAIFAELKRQHFSGMFSIEHESNWLHNLPDVEETVAYYNDQVAKLK